MKKRILKKGVLTSSQIRRLMSAGYFSKKGKRVAKEVLKGKHNKTRYKYK